ncbi:MAG: 30S ribosomal protein S9 [Candidatus Zambryskibacteria bacterium]|nr:30S ribosomal protein S9 [Candidatus Zambryskibacteria bacterium]
MTLIKEHKYIEAVGRRKTSTARVRITPAAKTSLVINEREFEKYFPTAELRNVVLSVFKDMPGEFSVTAKLNGGGISSQAQALRHGIARAMIENEPDLRTKLKVQGFLKRDPRAKERRKFGLKKARKAPQWSKR